MYRRGLSSVVVGVLIVLISLVAVGILWVAVVPLLKNSTGGLVSDCFNNDMYIKTCTYDNTSVSLLVSRGSSNGNISGVKFVFDQQNQKTILDSNDSAPGPIESKRYIFTRSSVPIPSYVQVIAVLPGGKLCAPSNVQVSCGATDSLKYNAMCNDGIDNDGDGLVDLNDLGCTDSNDNDETNAPGSWVKLNGGNPVDGGQPFAGLNFIPSPRQVTTTHDSAGNILYTFVGNNPDSLYLGRLNKTKSWELLTFNGWSRSSIDIPRPISENRFVSAKTNLFPTSTNIIGLFSATPRFSNDLLDVHPRTYSFAIDNQGTKYWSADEGYGSNLVTALSISVHATGGYDYDSDRNNNIILALSTDRQSNSVLTASKYNFQTGIWQSWKNGQWSIPSNFVYTDLTITVPKLPFSGLSDDLPTVTSIPGTEDFLILYRSRTAATGSYNLKAARYYGLTDTWALWNNGWQNNFALQPQALTQDNFGLMEPSRLSFIDNNKFYTLYKESTGASPLRVLSYDLSSSWNDGQLVSSAIDFVEGKDDNGNTWLAYTHNSKIILSQFTNGILTNPSEIYTLGSGSHLVGIDFLENHPIIFISEKSGTSSRLYVLGRNDAGYWDAQQTISSTAAGQTNTLDVAHGQEISQWNTNSMKGTIVYNNTVYNLTSLYSSPGVCGHMDMDSENHVYCPKTKINNVGIFPQNYVPPSQGQADSAVNWGGDWDYLEFPSSISVYNAKNETYITDSLPEGSQGDPALAGRLQVWNKSWNSEFVVRDIPYNNTVVVVNPDRWLPAVFNKAESNHYINWPADSAVNEQRGLLYVTETNFNRVLIYDIGTNPQVPTFIKSFGMGGSSAGQFNHPQGIDVDSSGNVFVVDSGNHRIQRFDYNGNYISQWGSIGSGDGEFLYPYAISIDKIKNYVYVTDPQNHRLQIFHSDGSFAYSFGQWNSPSGSEAVHSFYVVGGVVAKNNVVFVGAKSQDTLPQRIVKFQMNLP